MFVKGEPMGAEPKESDPQRQQSQLEQDASRPQPAILIEFVDFLLHNKKWWLIPIVLVLLLFGLLVMLSGTGAAPFIYTLF